MAKYCNNSLKGRSDARARLSRRWWTEAARFGPKLEDPGKSEPLHPRGSVGFHAGVDVEGEADGENHAAMNQMLVALYPSLLLRRAETDPNEIGRKSVDFIENVLFGGTFEQAIGTKTLGNYAASGTEIIKVLGEKHVETGFPIVYTSADSVFQVAAHEHVIPIERLYEICEIARVQLTGEHAVGRVIARPFEGEPGAYTRTERRKDFPLSPPATVLDTLVSHGRRVHAIGKISEFFNGRGITSWGFSMRRRLRRRADCRWRSRIARTRPTSRRSSICSTGCCSREGMTWIPKAMARIGTPRP